MKIIIYAGLSVTYDEAREILDSTDDVEVVYKRPIKRGDISIAMKEQADIIGIIDGVFHQSPAVAHKEILEAINNEITVVGASSMGALRASELDELGMIGIGYVYEQYRDEKITSDDDVAVVLDSETLEALSVPLVSMEYVFCQAVAEGIIGEEEKNTLLKIAKEIYYPKRNYSILFSKSELDDEVKNRLIDFINRSSDIKKEDGKKLLKYIKEELT